MAFVVYGKIKDAEVNHAILDCLHMVMFMSINPRKTIESLKVLRREKVVETFNTFNFSDAWNKFSGLTIANLVSS
jgi:hypothetical protein